jgi:hypothetical protein
MKEQRSSPWLWPLIIIFIILAGFVYLDGQRQPSLSQPIQQPGVIVVTSEPVTIYIEQNNEPDIDINNTVSEPVEVTRIVEVEITATPVPTPFARPLTLDDYNWCKLNDCANAGCDGVCE